MSKACCGRGHVDVGARACCGDGQGAMRAAEQNIASVVSVAAAAVA